MPSGGARASAGRPPDPNALNRDRKSDAEWLTLPAEPRKVKAPKWPLAHSTPRELELWRSLWRKPIAAIWEQDQQFEYVAMYVRTFVEAEEPDAAPTRRTLVARMAGELLLTIPAMHSARIKFAKDEVAVKRTAAAAPTEARKSSRDRMKVVNSGAGE